MKIDRKIVWKRFGGNCAYCGKQITLREMQIDHLVPVRRGDSDADLAKRGVSRGTDDYSNLMPACRSCNFRKGQMSLEKFREALIKQCEGVIKRSFQVRQSMDYGLIQHTPRTIVFYFEKRR
jgi:5-methylcytosine-specific restriction endonuclease McrA